MSKVNKGRRFISTADVGSPVTITLENGKVITPDKTIESKTDSKVTFTDGSYIFLNLGVGLKYNGSETEGLRDMSVKYIQGSGSSKNTNYMTNNRGNATRNRTRNVNRNRSRNRNRNRNRGYGSSAYGNRSGNSNPW